MGVKVQEKEKAQKGSTEHGVIYAVLNISFCFDYTAKQAETEVLIIF